MKAKLLENVMGLTAGAVVEIVSQGDNSSVVRNDEGDTVVPNTSIEVLTETDPQAYEAPPARAMRAKLQVRSIEPAGDGEIVKFFAVAKKDGYPEDGSDEDNTFAKFSPSADFSINIQNPALKGAFKPGEKYYADFTLAEEAPENPDQGKLPFSEPTIPAADPVAGQDGVSPVVEPEPESTIDEIKASEDPENDPDEVDAENPLDDDQKTD